MVVSVIAKLHISKLWDVPSSGDVFPSVVPLSARCARLSIS
jgi:hypothetical protein